MRCHLKCAPVGFYLRCCGNVILSDYSGMSRNSIPTTPPASVAEPRSRFPYRMLGPMQNSYRHRINATRGKATQAFAAGFERARSFALIPRMMFRALPPVRSQPYQTGANGSARVRARHKNPPHDENMRCSHNS